MSELWGTGVKLLSKWLMQQQSFVKMKCPGNTASLTSSHWKTNGKVKEITKEWNKMIWTRQLKTISNFTVGPNVKTTPFLSLKSTAHLNKHLFFLAIGPNVQTTPFLTQTNRIRSTSQMEFSHHRLMRFLHLLLRYNLRSAEIMASSSKGAQEGICTLKAWE